MNDSDKSRKPSAEGSQAYRDAAPIFPLSSTKGGEGRGEEAGKGYRDAPPFSPLPPTRGGEGGGEEAQGFPAQIPSPQPSPRSGGERETGAVSRCTQVSLTPGQRAW